MPGSSLGNVGMQQQWERSARRYHEQVNDATVCCEAEHGNMAQYEVHATEEVCMRDGTMK